MISSDNNSLKRLNFLDQDLKIQEIYICTNYDKVEVFVVNVLKGKVHELP